MERLRIPANRPLLRFDAGGVPDVWASFLAHPVLGSDVVLFGGSALATDGSVPALLAVDRWSGVERFRVVVDVAGEAYSSLPLCLDGGRAAFAVYDKDQALRVFVVSREGAIEAVDTIGVEDGIDRRDEYSIRAFDGAAKLHMMPPLRAGGGYAASWIYRQVRFYRTEVRRPGEPRPVWASPEACMAAVAGALVGVTPPRSGAEHLVAREAMTGTELWRRPFASSFVAGAGTDAVVIVERQNLDAAWRARDERMVEAAESVTGELPGDFFEAWERSHPLEACSGVVTIDARSGAERSRADAPGWIVSAVMGPGIIAAVSITEVGEVALSCFDSATGILRHRAPLPAGPPVEFGRPDPDLLPALVACDGERLLSFEQGALVCRSVTDEAEIWRIVFPGIPDGGHPRRQDRALSAPSVVVGDGCVYTRLSGRALGWGE